jgi:hypothetical protein
MEARDGQDEPGTNADRRSHEAASSGRAGSRLFVLLLRARGQAERESAAGPGGDKGEVFARLLLIDVRACARDGRNMLGTDGSSHCRSAPH